MFAARLFTVSSCLFSYRHHTIHRLPPCVKVFGTVDQNLKQKFDWCLVGDTQSFVPIVLSYSVPHCSNATLLVPFQACVSFKWRRDRAEGRSSGITTTPSLRNVRSSTMAAARGTPITSRAFRSARKRVLGYQVSSQSHDCVLLRDQHVELEE